MFVLGDWQDIKDTLQKSVWQIDRFIKSIETQMYNIEMGFRNKQKNKPDISRFVK